MEYQGTFALRLLYGIPAAPGDDNSAEQGLEIISLASESRGGIGWYLDETRPFMPNIAGLKGSASWVESASQDGRVLQSDAVGNEVETIYLELSGTLQQRYQYLSQLNRFADQARQFHSTYYQTRPVQLEWWAEGAPGAQWALIYDMSVAVQRASYDQGNTFQVTLTLEREPAWRGVMFGLPATVWTKYMRNQTPGSYDLSELSLIDGDALVSATVDNKHEFDGVNGYTADDPPLSKNWIDIDADMIPGDAPALISLSTNITNLDDHLVSGTAFVKQFTVSRSTKPRELVCNNGTNRPQFYTLNAGDAHVTSGTKTTTANAEDGVISNGSSTQRYYWAQAASTSTQYMLWGSNESGAAYGLSNEAFRGSFAAFVRGQVVTDIPTIQLWAGPGSVESTPFLNAEVAITESVELPIGSSEKKLFYIGDFTLPLSTNGWQGEDGAGVDVAPMTKADSDLVIYAAITPGGTSGLQIIDLVLMPYDEGQIAMLDRSTATANGATADLLLDNTGYIPRKSISIGRQYGNSRRRELELIGTDIQLLPGTNNRLYCLLEADDSEAEDEAAVDSSFTVNVNIIPRWYGVRDV